GVLEAHGAKHAAIDQLCHDSTLPNASRIATTGAPAATSVSTRTTRAMYETLRWYLGCSRSQIRNNSSALSSAGINCTLSAGPHSASADNAELSSTGCI